MNDKQMEALLGKADFSRETDLKARLRSQLFGEKVIPFPGARRVALSDEDVAFVNAAGLPKPPMNKQLEDL